MSVPAIDSRCSDPAFAEKYPSACRHFTRLILKNENSRGVGSGAVTVQFNAFAAANGQEVQLTAGVAYSSSRTSVATINSTGLATKVAAGKTTISATWNNQVAYAQLEISVAAPVSNYLVLLDNSWSMQQNFDSAYPTKLAFGKYLAERFFQSMRSTVDSMAFGNFARGADVNLDLSQTIADLVNSTEPIQVVHEMTDLRDAIEDGIEYLNGNATSEDALKVLVLLTDGQYNVGDIPGPVAREFKQGGGIIFVVGIRVFDVYFQILNELSTKGYFLSAYGGNAEAVASNLIGLKAFLGGGDCPGGAVFGCLTSPLSAQIADPDPLQVIPEN